MDFINTHIVKCLGMAIVHSLWQIGIIAFIYFYFLLLLRKLNIKQKYASGLICLVIVLFSFIITFLTLNNQNNPILLASSENISDTKSESLQIENRASEEVYETRGTTEHFNMNFIKFKMLLNRVAGVIGAIWLLGVFFFIYRKFRAYFILKDLKNNKYNVRSKKWEITLREISTALNLKKHIDILFSPFVNSPLTFGFIKPVILFPLRLTTGLSNEEIKCILIHELAHNLRNDYLFNVFQNVMEALFFYHPGVWRMSKNIRVRREIICDKIVIDTNISEKYYANTLLKLGELQASDSNLAIAAKRNNNELFTRIKCIIGKFEGNKKRKRTPFLIVAIILIFIVSGFAYHSKDSFISSSDLRKDIEEKLAPYKGSFALYDFKQNKYYTFSDSISKTRYSTYSTFKIASSLIALDIGIAKDEFYTIKYDSLKHPLPNWMKDDIFFKNWYRENNLKSALYYSVNWYYKELGAQIGNNNMIKYLNKLNYGNKFITSGNNAFWFNGQLKISALEQVEFLKNILNQDCNNISEEAQILTKKIIPGEKGSNYSIYGKTGTGEITDKSYIGWYVGYLETKDNSYTYALNIFSDDIKDVPRKKRLDIVKTIFSDLGVIDK